MHIHLADHFRVGTSWLHRLDPRAKLVIVVAFILGVSLTPIGAWAPLGGYLAIVLLAAGTSGLGWAYAVRRSFVAAPFVLAALTLPLTVPGEPLFVLPGLGWIVSEPGMVRFASVVLRTWLAIQAAILLAGTTPFPDLLWSLTWLRAPGPLVAIVGFMYRYLFLSADEAMRMLRARASRSVSAGAGRRPSMIWQGRVAGNMVGSLFLRSIERSERVYDAMVARGYDGQVRSLVHFHFRPWDGAVLLAAAAVLATLVLWSVRV